MKMTPEDIALEVANFVSQWQSAPDRYVLVRSKPGDTPWMFYDLLTEVMQYVDEDDEGSNAVMSQLATLGIPVVDNDATDMLTRAFRKASQAEGGTDESKGQD